MTSPAPHSVSSGSSDPLGALWGIDGAAPLMATAITAAELPATARALLDHSHTMTATLATHYGAPIGVCVLAAQTTDHLYSRKVALTAGDTVVQIAVIRVPLLSYSDEQRAAILAGERPFGALLAEMDRPYVSTPHGFIAVTPDADLTAALGADEIRRPLYGRHNRIMDADGALLAETLEVLAAI